MTARPLSPAEAAIVARFDAAEPAPESWRPVGDGDGQDELRGLLADGAWIRVANAFYSRGLFIDNGDVGHIARYLADALLPVVTAWADARARERAAEELESAAAVRWADKIAWAEVRLDLRRRAAALAADDWTDHGRC